MARSRALAPRTDAASTASGRLLSATRVPVLIALVLLVVLAGLVPATDASATVGSGKVRGAIVQTGGGTPKVKLLWFASDWRYLGARRADGGGYSLTLQPGRYFLQFVDLRPSYDVEKSAPATVGVTVSAGSTTVKNVRMRRGASIGGTVTAGGKPAAGARVVAANTSELSFESTADSHGNYALGGLPPGKYSVFTYDRKREWVARSVYLGKVDVGRFRRTDVRLGTRAGNLLLDLYAGGDPVKGTAYVTAVSVSTGQFWTARVQHGSVTFTGLYPGRYRVQVPGIGIYLPVTVTVRAPVRSGKIAFGSARLTRRGGWVTGRVVDANRPEVALSGATVRLFSASGALLATTTTSSTGSYTLEGQLTTQAGLSVVAGPGPYTDYLGQGTSYCKYAETELAGLSLRTGAQTTAEVLALDHLPNSDQDGEQCWTTAS